MFSPPKSENSKRNFQAFLFVFSSSRQISQKKYLEGKNSKEFKYDFLQKKEDP